MGGALQDLGLKDTKLYQDIYFYVTSYRSSVNPIFCKKYTTETVYW